MMEDQNAGDGGSNTKRLDHNAKERNRRVRLRSSYSELSAVLPNSTESKKRESSAALVDRVLKYIPEMESEIENLKQVRDNIMQSSNSKSNRRADQDPHSQLQSPTVTVTKVKNGEAIIQICTWKDYGRGFSNTLRDIEAQGISIRSASTVNICDDTICYQLHIEVPYGSMLPSPEFIITLL